MIFDLDCRIIQNEQYSRRESVIISGIPDNISHNDLEPTVIRTLKAIGLKNISSYEITACHHLYKKRNDKFPAKTIIRFTNRKAVEFCLKHRDRLIEIKNDLKMNLRFYESLCNANQEVVRECFKLKKYGQINNYYIQTGFVKIINKVGDRPLKIYHPDIYHPDILYNHFINFYDHENVETC